MMFAEQRLGLFDASEAERAVDITSWALARHAKFLRQCARQAEIPYCPEYANLREIVVPDPRNLSRTRSVTIDFDHYHHAKPLPAVSLPHILRGTNFSGAVLCGLNLSGRDLRGVNFSKADLRYADLRDSEITVDNFAGARLDGANLAGAKFYSLPGRRLHDVRLDENGEFRRPGPTVRRAFGAASFFMKGGFASLLTGDVDRALGRPDKNVVRREPA